MYTLTHLSEHTSLYTPLYTHDGMYKGVEDGTWGELVVPSNWEMEGHGHPTYTNVQYVNWFFRVSLPW
jgi:beta-galactosidase/beta-glucuronidase